MGRSIILVLILSIPIALFSQDEGSKNGKDKKNEISVFLGAITNSDATAFAIGLDYQYRINKVIGVGGLVDYASGDIESLLLGPALFLHAWHFEFTIAPTLEFSGDDTAYPIRVGVAYEIELPVVSISPSVYFDSERNDESGIVYGLLTNSAVSTLRVWI